MWLREPVPIEVSAVASTPIGFQLWDEDANEPLSITGMTVSCTVARVDGIGAQITHPVDVTEPSSGQFNIDFDGRIYPNPGQNAVTYSYQVKISDGQGYSVIAMRGPIFLVPGIS